MTPKERNTVVGVVAGLLGFVAVFLVAALVAVIYKRSKKPVVSGAVNLPLVRDNEPGPGWELSMNLKVADRNVKACSSQENIMSVN